MAISDSVKSTAAKLVEKTLHAFACVHYLHPTRSRQEKREAIVKMKTIATERRKAKEKEAEKRKARKKDAKKRKAKEKAVRRDSRNPKPRRGPIHIHFNFNDCTFLRCQCVSVH